MPLLRPFGRYVFSTPLQTRWSNWRFSARFHLFQRPSFTPCSQCNRYPTIRRCLGITHDNDMEIMQNVSHRIKMKSPQVYAWPRRLASEWLRFSHQEFEHTMKLYIGIVWPLQASCMGVFPNSTWYPKWLQVVGVHVEISDHYTTPQFLTGAPSLIFRTS